MCITISVTEQERRMMGLATTIINVILVFASLTLFCLAIVIRYKLDEKLELMDGYNSGALPYYLMVVAGIMFFCHLVAINFCYNAAYVETRSSQHHIFVSLICVVIAVMLLLIITEIVIAVHSSKIRNSLSDGIYKAMKTYKSNLDNKIKTDILQRDYQCCGSDSFKEWFKISWVNPYYVNVDNDKVKRFLKDGEFIKDDVPFSCCNKYSKRACVHHSVQNPAAHRNYEGHTLYTIGCVDVLMSYFKRHIITPTVLFIIAVMILQAIDVAVMRLLQTSIFEAEEMNDPEGPSMAYCIKGVGGGEDNRRYLKRKPEPKSKKGSDDDEDTDGDDDGGGDDSESDTAAGSRGDVDDTGGDEDRADDSAGQSADKDSLAGNWEGGAVLGESRSAGQEAKADDGPGKSHDDDGGGGGGGGDRGGDSKKSKEETKREKEEKKEEKKKKKEEKEKEKADKKDEKKKKKEDKEKDKADKKEEKKKKKEDKKKEKKDKKEDKKKKQEDKKKEKKDKKDEKKKQKTERKAKKKDVKEEKIKKQQEKKAGKKDKKKDKKKKDTEKKAKKKAEKDKKKKANKEKKAKKKAETDKKKKAKKDAKAKKNAEKKRKKQAKKETKAKKKKAKPKKTKKKK